MEQPSWKWAVLIIITKGFKTLAFYAAEGWQDRILPYVGVGIASRCRAAFYAAEGWQDRILPYGMVGINFAINKGDSIPPNGSGILGCFNEPPGEGKRGAAHFLSVRRTWIQT